MEFFVTSYREGKAKATGRPYGVIKGFQSRDGKPPQPPKEGGGFVDTVEFFCEAGLQVPCAGLYRLAFEALDDFGRPRLTKIERVTQGRAA